MTVSPAAASLEHLLDKVENRLLSTGTQGHVNKVEITRGQKLQFELMLGDKLSWFTWEANALRELKIAKDRKIPLARKLADEQFAHTVTVLSYRPGRRLTLLDRAGRKPRVLKGYRRGRLEQMVRQYETAQKAFSGLGICTPGIIEYDTANQCLVMMHQPGERLTLSTESTDLFHLAGEAIRGFQDHESASAYLAFDRRDELAVVDGHAGRLRSVTGRLPELWPDLRARLESAESALPYTTYGLAHRDLHDKQFVRDERQLILLDFDLMCTADNTLDPANFLAHLVLRSLQGAHGATQSGIDVCGKKFLQGLGRNEEPGFWERLRFYQATSFARLALVYSLRPRWAGLVPDLISMGNRCLDDLQRLRGQ